jgi:eukaryotic-like serine/threonine-protein kinase
MAEPCPRRVEELFDQALDLDPARLPTFLDEQCAGDAGLRAAVEELLHLDRRAEATETLLRGPVAESRLRAIAPAAPPLPGVGRYRLLRVLGEGGMGTVYEAEQQEPVKRRVALKVLKPGLGSKEVVARFEAERQALALMDHPHIARVLDADATEAGRPYFVMELVRGVPITAFCDEHRLTVRQRLELVVPVCQAIQHAHTKGVIHRDIKPSNVLVALYDGVAVPKVIDFGIAKALEQRLTDQTLDTGTGQVLGTLEYMSPEQARLDNRDIDTRSDVYALGVLLYELLTGSTPLTSQRLRGLSIVEILRLIGEEEPPRPSTRLGEEGELPAIAARRRAEPGQLRQLLRGELDWVVLKALDKDRARRYETPSALARDVERYLRDEPVQACPPSSSYRLRKFARRHRAALGVAAAILLLLLAGVAVSTWQAVRATNAEGTARLAEKAAAAREKSERQAREQAERDRDAKELARQKEAQERTYAQAIADFVRDDFLALTSVRGQIRFGGPTEVPLDKATTLRQLLDRAAAKLNRRHDLDPRIEAELRWMIGVNYRMLGEAGRAIPFLERCVALRQKWFGPGHDKTLRAQNSLAVAYQDAGKLDLALPLLAKTLKLTKARLGADDPDTLVSMGNLALGYRDAGKLGLALPLWEETLQRMKARLGADNPETLVSMNGLAETYRAAGKLGLALPLLEETLQRMKARLGADDPRTLVCMSSLAGGYRDAGKVDLALPLLEEALQRMKARLGADHPQTLLSMNYLALGYQAAGKLDLALPLLEETLQRMKARLDADHPDTLLCMKDLAVVYRDTGKLGLALPLLEEALQRMKARLGADHPVTLRCMNSLGEGYRLAGKLGLVLPLLEEALKLAKARLGDDHPDTLSYMKNLAGGYRRAGKLGLALPLLEEALQRMKARLGADHPETLGCMNSLGEAYRATGKLGLALPLLEEALKRTKARLGADHPETLLSMNSLAIGYRHAGKLDRALPLWEEALKRKQARLGADHPETLLSMSNLAVGYRDAGKLDLALPLFQRAAAGMEKLRFQNWYADSIVSNLILTYDLLRQFDRSESWRRKWLAVVKERSGADSVPYAAELIHLGRNLLIQKKWAEAESVLREALGFYENKQPDAWTTFDTQSLLGGALAGQQKYAEAEPLLRKGYEGLKQRQAAIPPGARGVMAGALTRLVRLYEATGQKDRAEAYRKELGRLKRPSP